MHQSLMSVLMCIHIHLIQHIFASYKWGSIGREKIFDGHN